VGAAPSSVFSLSLYISIYIYLSLSLSIYIHLYTHIHLDVAFAERGRSALLYHQSLYLSISIYLSLSISIHLSIYLYLSISIHLYVDPPGRSFRQAWAPPPPLPAAHAPRCAPPCYAATDPCKTEEWVCFSRSLSLSPRCAPPCYAATDPCGGNEELSSLSLSLSLMLPHIYISNFIYPSICLSIYLSMSI